MLKFTCQLHSAADDKTSTSSAFVKLLDQFSDIFVEPTELPPARPGFDHKIPLKEGTNPFSIRPYRYSILYKYIIDKLVEDMLQHSFIQHSNSPFAPPVVRKKNGTWWLCVDYRKLNQNTIKDKFPVPLIEDLMDELGGTTIFSKLDLTASYHQLRMEGGKSTKLHSRLMHATLNIWSCHLACPMHLLLSKLSIITSFILI